MEGQADGSGIHKHPKVKNLSQKARGNLMNKVNNAKFVQANSISLRGNIIAGNAACNNHSNNLI